MCPIQQDEPSYTWMVGSWTQGPGKVPECLIEGVRDALVMWV